MDRFFYLPPKARAVVEALHQKGFHYFEELENVEDWFPYPEDDEPDAWGVSLDWGTDDYNDENSLTYLSAVYAVYKPTADCWVFRPSTTQALLAQIVQSMWGEEWVTWATEIIQTAEASTLVPEGQLTFTF